MENICYRFGLGLGKILGNIFVGFAKLLEKICNIKITIGVEKNG